MLCWLVLFLVDRLYDSAANARGKLAVFHPAYIDACLQVGDMRKVSIGDYYLPPADMLQGNQPHTNSFYTFHCIGCCWSLIRTAPHKKGKVFPYSLPSVGPGADPSVQAVSPQVTWSESRHRPGSRLPLLSARPAVTSVAFTRWRYL